MCDTFGSVRYPLRQANPGNKCTAVGNSVILLWAVAILSVFVDVTDRGCLYLEIGDSCVAGKISNKKCRKT
jgi:hypothetical protein